MNYDIHVFVSPHRIYNISFKSSDLTLKFIVLYERDSHLISFTK